MGMDYRQIILLFGIRRAGKTTLMHQLIDHLLRDQQVDPFRIVYFSFDLQELGLEGILESYELEILKQDIRDAEKIYLFLDEIQKLNDWSNKVKILYDQYPNLKIILSGSAALPLQKGTKESLAGRFFEFRVDPLSFNEFLEFLLPGQRVSSNEANRTSGVKCGEDSSVSSSINRRD